MNKDNNCVECNQDTSFGSLKFINRIPFNDSYLCPDCLQQSEKEFEVERDKEIAQFKLEKGLKK